MYQDVERFKAYDRHPQQKDFDAAVSHYNLRAREAKRSYLTDLFKAQAS